MVPAALVITGMTFVFAFRVHCISVARSVYFRDFSVSFLMAYSIIIIIIIALSPLCRVVTIIYLKQTMFLGCILLQLFRNYNIW